MSRSLEDWLSWQETLHPRSIDLGLARVAAVAGRLGLPDARPVTLTVGGTNGKGSSAHLAASIYREAGWRVGLYTSPHLLHYNERVRVDGTDAADAELCRAFEAIEAVRGDTALTYFEFGTLAALWLFREARVEVQVLEVGLGGRLDAVNLVDADAALVTSVGLDHLDWLGPDRESIGREKAGIFRAARPAIVADPDPPRSVLDASQALGADLRQRGRDFDVRRSGAVFDWHGRTQRCVALPLPGLGDSDAQLANAAGVLAAIEALQRLRPVDESAIRRALPALRLPGRCEQRGSVVLDVAHNVEAARVLAGCLDALPSAHPTVLLLGMLADKPHADFHAALRERIDATVLVSLPGPRGLTSAQLAARLPADVRGRCCDNMRAALAEARRIAGAGGRIVVTGSFLTVAAATTELDG